MSTAPLITLGDEFAQSAQSMQTTSSASPARRSRRSQRRAMEALVAQAIEKKTRVQVTAAARKNPRSAAARPSLSSPQWLPRTTCRHWAA